MARRGRIEVVEGGPPPWWRGNWWIWLLLLAIGVVVAVVLLLVFEGDDEEEEAAGVPVPSVVGLDEAEARDVLAEAGFEVDEETVDDEAPEDEVVAQEPEAGAEVEEGSTVRIDVSRGPPETTTVTETETAAATETETAEPETTEMPDVLGGGHVDAGAAVDAAGLLPETYPVASDEPAGTVVAQNPEPGTELEEGERVRLNVSEGPDERPEAPVPDVTGPMLRDALAVCREAGFTCRILDRDAPSSEEVGEVIDQAPRARSVTAELTQITLYVGR